MAVGIKLRVEHAKFAAILMHAYLQRYKLPSIAHIEKNGSTANWFNLLLKNGIQTLQSHNMISFKSDPLSQCKFINKLLLFESMMCNKTNAVDYLIVLGTSTGQ